MSCIQAQQQQQPAICWFVEVQSLLPPLPALTDGLLYRSSSSSSSSSTTCYYYYCCYCCCCCCCCTLPSCSCGSGYYEGRALRLTFVRSPIAASVPSASNRDTRGQLLPPSTSFLPAQAVHPLERIPAIATRSTKNRQIAFSGLSALVSLRSALIKCQVSCVTAFLSFLVAFAPSCLLPLLPCRERKHRLCMITPPRAPRSSRSPRASGFACSRMIKPSSTPRTGGR
jgi:hypothetical protein